LTGERCCPDPPDWCRISSQRCHSARISKEGTINNVQGNVQGLKPSQIRQLEKLYQRRIPPRAIVTQEFARHLTEVSREISRQVGVLVNRNGYVEHVVVGNARAIMLPDLKRTRVGADRFRGLRCLHTHLSGEDLTRDDLTDLALLRLDLMAAIETQGDGLPGLVRAAYMLPAVNSGSGSDGVPLSADGEAGDAPPAGTRLSWGTIEPRVPSQLDIDFLEFIASLEEEMARTRRVRNKNDDRERAILVGVTTASARSAQESLDELRELARSSGAVVLDAIVQRRPKLDPRSLVGRGKLEELIIRGLQLGADVLYSTTTSPRVRLEPSGMRPTSKLSIEPSSSWIYSRNAPAAGKGRYRWSWPS